MLQKLKERWVLFLFGAPFAAVGLGFLFWGIVPQLAQWTAMKSWEPVQAQIVSAEMKSHRSDDSTTYSLHATYRYQYQGQNYTGNRVGISSGSDNVGDYHQRVIGPLERAERNGSTVTAWVNPQQPEQAVLNRELRLSLILFKGLFVLLFGGVGLGMWAYVFIARPDKTDVSEFEAQEKPWLSRNDWASPTIKSDGKTGMWALWVFAAFWNLISLPAAIGAVGEALGGNHAAWLALLFPLVGAGIVFWAIKLTLAWRRFGHAPVTLDPYPGAIGGQVGGALEVALPYQPDNSFAVTLQCLHSYYTGSGKNRKRRESMVWQSEGIAQTSRSAHGTRVEWLFEVDEGLPESEPPGNRYHLWRVNIKCELPGADFDRNYEIPVFATGDKAQQLGAITVSSQHPEMAQQREQLLEDLFDIRQVPGGVILHYPAFRNLSTMLVLILMGAIFSGIGLWLDADGFPEWIFALIGLPMFFGGLYSLCSSLDVRIDRTELITRRRILGLSLGNKHTPRSEITKLFIDESYSSSTGNKHTTYYKIKAELRSGGKKTISHSLPGRELAQEALESLSLLTGVPCQ
ncbi:DUF3592 domain-containing protein [Gilvimarinus sp. DA14]|uniref:DUF3592 domain-containing protein n=1 Tax=Gilvimarinus sp. DA14 TaxID=2956798 RepID=UPI0020B74F82|nr:DUF3592 domain-containing protein [Gilvimarinus sp. DA14]UTF60002.1 DUF3592 domain-containing protein [Gilvimarinus sp. DA14]